MVPVKERPSPSWPRHPKPGAGQHYGYLWPCLGPLFTLFRVLVALVNGMISGWTVNLFGGGNERVEVPTPTCCPHAGQTTAGKLHHLFDHGFVRLPRDIGGAIMVGVLLSGTLSILIPPDFFADTLHSGILSMLLIMAAGIPFMSVRQDRFQLPLL